MIPINMLCTVHVHVRRCSSNNNIITIISMSQQLTFDLRGAETGDEVLHRPISLHALSASCFVIINFRSQETLNVRFGGGGARQI